MIKDLFKRKQNALTEALKFGSSEFKFVDSASKDFLIGVEYEIHIDREYLDTDYDTEPFFDEIAYNEQLLSDIDELKRRYFSELEDAVEFAIRDDGDEDTPSKAVTLLDVLTRSTGSVGQQTLFDVEITPSQIENQADLSVFESIEDDIVSIEDDLPAEMLALGVIESATNIDIDNLISDAASLKATIESTPDDSIFDADVLFDMGRVLRTYLRLVDKLNKLDLDDYNNAFDRRYGANTEFDEYVRDRASEDMDTSEFYIYEEIGSVESAIRFCRENLPDSVMRHVEKVEEDASVKEGCEVVTYPLPLQDALRVMTEMFSFISEYGSTSNSTGMHVNISHKLMKGNINSFDVVKMYFLADPEYHQGFSRRTDRPMYEPRNYVGRMINGFDRRIVEIARAYNSGGIENVRNWFDDNISSSQKYQAINFGAIQNANESTRRVEFRYFGGEDYHRNYNDIRRDLYYACYVLLAAVKPDFLRREANQEMIKHLNRVTRKSKGMDFLSFASEQREKDES